MTDLSDILTFTQSLAEQAGRTAMHWFRSPLDIVQKADESPVTAADRAIETEIRTALQQRFPADGLWGEEFGVQAGASPATWIVDPIDGTRSFITGFPLFGTMIGRLWMGEPQLGVIRMSALNETFAGAQGLGAMLNGRPIRARGTRRLADAYIYINEAPALHARNPALFSELCRTGHTRRTSCDCYPHALVAAGQVDVVIDCNLQPYDYLPLVPVIEAAGGTICDWSGRTLGPDSDGYVLTAATGQLRDEMLGILQQHREKRRTAPSSRP